MCVGGSGKLNMKKVDVEKRYKEMKVQGSHMGVDEGRAH